MVVANALKQHFGDAVDLFGFGHRPLPDKAAALDEYIFSVVIENVASPHYISEKLTDCLLGASVPIYSGASLASEYLDWHIPEIPFGADPDLVIKLVKKIIATFDYSESKILKARNRVLRHLNVLEYMPYILAGGAIA